jgi:hypothetical protein
MTHINHTIIRFKNEINPKTQAQIKSLNKNWKLSMIIRSGTDESKSTISD